MKYIVFASLLFIVASDSYAGGNRSQKLQNKAARIALRRERVASGVTLTRAKTQLARAEAVANVTGLFSPFSLIRFLR